MRSRRNARLIIIALALVLFFSWVGAVQARGLVPCGNEAAGEPPCNFCHLFQLVDNIVDTIIFPIVPVIAVLVIVIGGVYLFFGGPSEKAYTTGKRLIKNAVIGLIIVYVGWVVVGSVIAFIVERSHLGSFNFTATKGIVIQCDLTKVEEPTIPEITVTREYIGGGKDIKSQCKNAPGATPDLVQCTCVNCVSLRALGIPVKNNDWALSGLAQALKSLGGTSVWQVTEAWQPTSEHKSECHRNGSCVDVNFTVAISANREADRIKAFIQEAGKKGLLAVYEVKTDTRRNELIQAGVPFNRISTQGHITGEHFSVSYFGP